MCHSILTNVRKKKQQSVSVSLERKKERKNYIPLDIVENRKRNVPVEREDFIAMNSRKKKKKKILNAVWTQWSTIV